MSKFIKIFVNFITTSRLIGAIILICLLKNITMSTFFIWMFILYLTDLIDGFLARHYHVETFYGSLMDTLADKTLNICLIIPLLQRTSLISIVLILEVIIMLTNIIGKIKGKKISTEYIGKIKMWFVALSILAGYLYYYELIRGFSLKFAIIAAGFVQVLTIIDYIIYFKEQKNTQKYFQFRNAKEFINALFDTEYYKKNN